MKHLRKWTVCLGMEELDEVVLNQIAVLAKFFRPETLHLLHVIEGTDMPPMLLNEYPDLDEPKKEYYYNRMQDLCQQYLPEVENLNVEILEGNKLKTILSSLVERETDLVVMGRRKSGGTIMKKIVRKSSASVLIVPEGRKGPLTHAVVATDFSEHSLRALQIASNLTTAMEIPKTTVVHVFNDSSKYTGQPMETAYDVDEVLKKRLVIEEKLRDYSIHRLSAHVRESGVKSFIEQRVIPTRAGGKKSEALVELVKEEKADFIILGAKGQSVAQALLLGSFAEDVYPMLYEEVILLFKKKGENAGFLKLLLGKS
jgi:nucleotide-binding universal stress UspA family protein